MRKETHAGESGAEACPLFRNLEELRILELSVLHEFGRCGTENWLSEIQILDPLASLMADGNSEDTVRVPLL